MQTWTKAIGVIGALLGTGTASAATALKVEVVTYGGTNAWSLFVQKDEMTDTEHYWTTSPPRFLEDINGR